MMESLCDLTSWEPWRLHLSPAERSPVFKRATGFGSPFHDIGTLAASTVGPCCSVRLGIIQAWLWLNQLQEASYSAFGWREVWVAAAANFSWALATCWQ